MLILDIVSTEKKSIHEVFMENYINYRNTKTQESLNCLEKTILKTKFLIPVYTEKTSKDRIFNENTIVDFITLQNKKNELCLPLFTTKQELLKLGEDVHFMIVNYYEAVYLSKSNNLHLIINPLSIEFEIPSELEQKRLEIEGIISPKLELMLKEYTRDKKNSQYIEILKALRTEILFMPLCIDETEDYTLSYKEFEDGKFLCLFVSQRCMYKYLPNFKAFETVNLDTILNILEMMDFQGILLPENMKVNIKTLNEL